jgi:hypothetical protein
MDRSATAYAPFFSVRTLLCVSPVRLLSFPAASAFALFARLCTGVWHGRIPAARVCPRRLSFPPLPRGDADTAGRARNSLLRCVCPLFLRSSLLRGSDEEQRRARRSSQLTRSAYPARNTWHEPGSSSINTRRRQCLSRTGWELQNAQTDTETDTGQGDDPTPAESDDDEDAQQSDNEEGMADKAEFTGESVVQCICADSFCLLAALVVVPNRPAPFSHPNPHSRLTRQYQP